ncbi:thiolase-like protein [Aspergillus leporis]|uniref:Thiolase-like protein n=1 Tax=Aspergillus leporis TaxID=41062 RepID=A0A5N5WIJ4_9EURO|nr:thiolase-like protein [Aspergillus leporis]
MAAMMDTSNKVSIIGTGLQYPPYKHGPEFIPMLVSRHYPSSPALQKVLEINMKTKIENRYSILPSDHPVWHQKSILTTTECDALFKEYGIPLAEDTARQALKDWGGNPMDITHVVAVTCTSMSSPGFDCTLCKNLGLGKNVRRTLLNGVTCASSIAAIRTAYELLLGASHEGKRARALVVACEAMTIHIRGIMEWIAQEETPNLGPVLFADGASALIMSNGICITKDEKPPLWNILGAQTTLLDNSDCVGIIPIITKELPKIIKSVLPSMFRTLIASTASLSSDENNYDPTTYDWALHPGGYSIIHGGEQALGLSPHHLRKSYDCYRTAGNTSSATVLGIIHRLAREHLSGEEGRDKMIGAAFGADITIEMIVFKKPSCVPDTL